MSAGSELTVAAAAVAAWVFVASFRIVRSSRRHERENCERFETIERLKADEAVLAEACSGLSGIGPSADVLDALETTRAELHRIRGF